MPEKALGMIGIAKKARKVVSGEFSCEKAIKAKEAYLCIVASDASDNTKKAFRNSCDFYHVPYVEFSTKDLLGHAIGNEFRASIAIIDEKLAKSILDKIEACK